MDLGGSPEWWAAVEISVRSASPSPAPESPPGPADDECRREVAAVHPSSLEVLVCPADLVGALGYEPFEEGGECFVCLEPRKRLLRCTTCSRGAVCAQCLPGLRSAECGICREKLRSAADSRRRRSPPAPPPPKRPQW